MRNILLGACSAVILSTAVAARAQQNPIPEKFTNLQVLPTHILREDLVPVMRGFSIQVGVRCEHCHVGEGNDLSRFDFASDARPAKTVARKMMLMLRAINGPLLQGVGAPPAAGGAKVTCFTCHRGIKTPLAAPAPVK